MDLDIEKMQADYDKFQALCEKVGPRSENLKALIEKLGERLVMSPSSDRNEYFNSFPGGLLNHALKILESSYKIAKGCGIEVPNESIILCSLFCLIGKVGDEKHDFYLPQDNNWRKENLGENYKFNDKLPHMRTTHRSLYLLQKFGVELSYDEWMAILLADGLTDDTRLYSMREPSLALVISSANKLVQSRSREEDTAVSF
jgi:hypothetical protein